MTSKRQMTKAKVWWLAFRYHFVPPSIFPAVLGGLVSWATNTGFIPLYFLLVLVAIIINHIGLNMTDDYYDYKHSVDKLKPGEKNPYTGGSGTLSSGLQAPKNMFLAFTLCFVVTMAVGLYLTAQRVTRATFGLIGVFCAVFYTAPPVSFSHHGLGELPVLVNFGTHRFGRLLRSIAHPDTAGISGDVAHGNHGVFHDCHQRNSRHRRRSFCWKNHSGGEIRKKSRSQTLRGKLGLRIRGNYRVSCVSDSPALYAFCFALVAPCVPFN